MFHICVDSKYFLSLVSKGIRGGIPWIVFKLCHTAKETCHPFGTKSDNGKRHPHAI